MLHTVPHDKHTVSFSFYCFLVIENVMNCSSCKESWILSGRLPHRLRDQCYSSSERPLFCFVFVFGSRDSLLSEAGRSFSIYGSKGCLPQTSAFGSHSGFYGHSEQNLIFLPQNMLVPFFSQSFGDKLPDAFASLNALWCI